LAAINTLRQYLEGLPRNLPLDPAQSNYSFELDKEWVQDEGVYAALNRSLEVAFQTHNLGGNELKLTERGKRLDALIALLIYVANKMDGGHDFLVDHWINRLTAAAKASGATIAEKRYWWLYVIIDLTFHLL
jgi:predicted NACHT family NTPase